MVRISTLRKISVKYKIGNGIFSWVVVFVKLYCKFTIIFQTSPVTPTLVRTGEVVRRMEKTSFVHVNPATQGINARTVSNRTLILLYHNITVL